MAAATASGPRYAPEDPSLPKPWKGLVDGKTGYLYFWNPVTNVTQYERPVGSAPPQKSSSVLISSSVHVQQASQGQRSSHENKDNYEKFSNEGSKLDAASRSQQARSETASGNSTARDSAPNTFLSAGYGAARGPGTSDGGSGLSAEAYRRRHEITVTGDNVPAPFTSFEATGFPSEILREVHSAGFSAPTPIQAQSWPVALQSRDIVAIAKTGSGKTVGYLFPGFMHLKRVNNDPRLGPTVLVLSPTRELATQIQDEAVKFGKSSRISCVCLYGGAPKGPQLRDLDRGADIVVATPGRLNDILEMRRISLHQVSYLVLDEADRMLDMGFEPQIRKIVKEVPTRRQTLMYTATWPKEVRKIAADLLVNPVQVNIGNVDELVANKAITQHVEVLAPMDKHRRLEQILRSQEPGSKIIIFCSTKKMCDQLARNLARQFGANAIHGDKSQSERDSVLSQFRTGRTPVLVATDVAARGLDIKDIRVVINYDFPTGVEDYVHRIGRTGRAGASGVAYTFFGDQDAKYASDLIKVLEGANQRVPPEVRSMASRGGGMSKFRRWGPGPSGPSGGRDGGRGGRSESSYGGRDGGRGGWGFSSSGGGDRGYDSGSRDKFDRGYQNERGRSRSRSPPRQAQSFHQIMMEKARSSQPAQPPHGGNNGREQKGYGDRASPRDRASSPRGRSRSRSPERGSGWGDRNRGWNRDRSRSPSRQVRSFHQAMMEKAHSSQPPHGGNNGREQKGCGDRASPSRDRASSPRGDNSREGSYGRSHGGGYADGPRSSQYGEEAEEGMILQDE